MNGRQFLQMHHAPKLRQVSALIEKTVQRLDPDEETGTDIDEGFITVGEAITALGPKVRALISRALCGKSLEDLVQTHRTDMAGLQVRLYDSRKSL